MDNGKKSEPHVAVIRKMVGPIPDPPGVLGDGVESIARFRLIARAPI
jgi:hypothetical protein